MRYFVTIDGRERPVDILVGPTGEFAVSVDGVAVQSDVVSLDEDTLSIRINDRVLDVTIEGHLGAGPLARGELGVIASGHRAYVQVESERVRATAAARRSGQAIGEKSIVAPMPGRVAKVLVEVGAMVSAGQGVVVIEAMKMENELRARAASKVAEIHVTAGQTIDSGDKLITFA